MRYWYFAIVVGFSFHLADASPTMCHCDNGAIGLQCPNPIQLNCPTPQCPPPQSGCNPFPTLPPHHGLDSLSQFTLPTLPSMGSLGQSITLSPLPIAQDQQQSLVSINNPAPYVPPPPPPVAQPQYNQQQQQAPQQYNNNNPVYQQQPPAPPQQNIDATTGATTLASHLYVEVENPEVPQQNYAPPSIPQYGNAPEEQRNPVRRESGDGPILVSAKCNDDRLKKIIEENITKDPSDSKRNIQQAASDKIGGLFDVICSRHDFSYLANTQLFCEAGNDDVTCFAFLHSLVE